MFELAFGVLLIICFIYGIFQGNTYMKDVQSGRKQGVEPSKNIFTYFFNNE